MRNLKTLLFLVALMFLQAVGEADSLGANNEAAPINPDRPSFSNSTSIVGKNVWQLESGWSETVLQDTDGTRSQSIQTPMLLRIAVQDMLEIRLATNGYTWNRDANQPSEGFGDSGAGMKWRHESQRGAIPAMASLVQILLPSGSRSVRAGGAQPSYAMPLDWTLDSRFSMTLMPGLSWNDTSAHQAYLAPLTSFIVNDAWCGRSQAFAEIAGQQWAEPRFGGNVVTADVGANYLITPDIAADASIWWGLNRFSPNVFYTAGLSIRAR